MHNNFGTCPPAIQQPEPESSLQSSDELGKAPICDLFIRRGAIVVCKPDLMDSWIQNGPCSSGQLLAASAAAAAACGGDREEK